VCLLCWQGCLHQVWLLTQNAPGWWGGPTIGHCVASKAILKSALCDASITWETLQLLLEAYSMGMNEVWKNSCAPSKWCQFLWMLNYVLRMLCAIIQSDTKLVIDMIDFTVSIWWSYTVLPGKRSHQTYPLTRQDRIPLHLQTSWLQYWIFGSIVTLVKIINKILFKTSSFYIFQVWRVCHSPSLHLLNDHDVQILANKAKRHRKNTKMKVYLFRFRAL
jgi:hypothetical protein